ncbi:hypothetical protein [Saccharopolyspora sp. NPDC002376]
MALRRSGHQPDGRLARGHTPVVLCDIRERGSAKEVLIALVEHASHVYAQRR